MSRNRSQLMGDTLKDYYTEEKNLETPSIKVKDF